MKLLSLMVPSKKEFDNSVFNIVQGPGYSHLKNGITDFIGTIKNMISKWLTNILKKFFNNIDSVASVSDKLSIIFIIVGIMAILAIILIIIVKVNKTFERKRKVKEILGERIDEKTTPRTLRNKALRFYETGDLRQAIRYDFIALLLLMHEHNLIYLDETKTNEEIYKYLRKNGFTMLEVFNYLTHNFNSTWYGNKEFDNEGYKHWSTNLNLLWNEVSKGEI